MGFFDTLLGRGAAKYPKKLAPGDDLESLEILNVEGSTVSMALKFNKKSLKPQPAPNTDIVFLIDASASMGELYASGAIQGAVWNILEHVLEYDDDGIDFFLHSASTRDMNRMRQVIEKIQSQTATLEDVKAVVAPRDLGQIADRAQLDKALGLDQYDFGFATLCAPALDAVMKKRKPNGNLFIELVTDGTFNDDDDVKRKIIEMSKMCAQAKNPNMFRIHILGIGDGVNEEYLNELDEGLSGVAPIDIVAFDKADRVQQSPQLIFKELEKGFMTVGNNGTVEVKGAKAKKITNAYNGVGEPEMLVLERVPQALLIDIDFESKPTAFGLDISFTDTEGDDFQVKAQVAL
jgi:hypothetical protein